jgi:hypothetical protein
MAGIRCREADDGLELTIGRLFKTRLSLRGHWLRCTVGPFAARRTQIALSNISCFEIEIVGPEASRVIVRERSGRVTPLELPLAPIQQHLFIVAWLERASVKARRRHH